MPSQGGLRTMLISAVESGGAAAGDAPAAGAAGGGKDQRAFALGATAGEAEPDASLPTGTLEVRLHDENQAPIANHSVLLGMVNKQGKIETRAGKSDAAGQARFTGLSVGQQTGYAVVIEWRGLRLNTSPFGMPDERRRARRDPGPGAHVRSGRDDHRRRRPHRCADARGRAAGPRVAAAREHLREDVRPRAGRLRDPAADRIRRRAAAGERTQAGGAAESRHRRPRRHRPQALAGGRVGRRKQGQRSGLRLRAARTMATRISSRRPHRTAWVRSR